MLRDWAGLSQSAALLSTVVVIGVLTVCTIGALIATTSELTTPASEHAAESSLDLPPLVAELRRTWSATVAFLTARKEECVVRRNRPFVLLLLVHVISKTSYHLTQQLLPFYIEHGLLPRERRSY